MKTKNKVGYIPPKCKISQVETENFICATITPHMQASGEEGWDPATGHTGGDMYIGEYESIAP